MANDAMDAMDANVIDGALKCALVGVHHRTPAVGFDQHDDDDDNGRWMRCELEWGWLQLTRLRTMVLCCVRCMYLYLVSSIVQRLIYVFNDQTLECSSAWRRNLSALNIIPGLATCNIF